MASRATSMSPRGGPPQPARTMQSRTSRGHAETTTTREVAKLRGRDTPGGRTPARLMRAGVPLRTFLRPGARSTSLLLGLLELIGDRGGLLLDGVGALECLLVVLGREGLASLLERSLVRFEIALEQRQVGPGVLGHRGDLQVPLGRLQGGVGRGDRRLGVLLGLLLVGHGGRRRLGRLFLGLRQELLGLVVVLEKASAWACRAFSISALAPSTSSCGALAQATAATITSATVAMMFQRLFIVWMCLLVSRVVLVVEKVIEIPRPLRLCTSSLEGGRGYQKPVVQVINCGSTPRPSVWPAPRP